MKPVLLFVHGWGFDASMWGAVRARFAPEDTLAWDLGFFGAPAQPPPPPGRPVIAVGHSFGTLWLLHRRKLPWAAMVAINGFTCFARREGFPHGVAPRVLARMRRRLQEASSDVVSEFLAACGYTAPTLATPNIEALEKGLAALETWDERAATPTLALCGEGDTLVPPEMSRACFSEISWHEGGHLLPLEAPDWCAAELAKLLA
jgi:pimeloyl-[acyl-carrier protein] methyl ester esterase